MKKVLFVTEKFPYPLDTGGKIRSYHILKGLSQECDVTLLCTADDRDRGHLSEIKKICKEVHVVDVQKRKGDFIKAFRNLFSKIPFVVERHFSHQMAYYVSVLSNEHDVIHLDHLDSSVYLKYINSQAKTVLDEHNIVSNQVKTFSEDAKGSLKGIYAKLQYAKTLKYERYICNSVDRCLVCSEADRAYLSAFAPKASISTIPNGVDIEFFSRKTSFSPLDGPPEVVFVGALDYGPGGNAVEFFYKDIFPLVRKKIPDARFIAVGQNPPESLQLIAKNDPGFDLTGWVADVRDYIQRAKVFVVPLRSGSGTRLKILSAMSMNVPVVSTSIGAEGLEVGNGENILIADSPENFSASVVQLIHNSDFASQLAMKGRKLVEGRYSWNFVWEKLQDVYREI